MTRFRRRSFACALAVLFAFAAQQHLVSSAPAPVLVVESQLFAAENVRRLQLVRLASDGGNGTTTDCDYFLKDFELSFNTMAPCKCNQLMYDIPPNDDVHFKTRQASFVVSLQCTGPAEVRDVAKVWSQKFVPALPVVFSADYNISSMAITYGISLVDIHADWGKADNSWDKLFSTNFNTPLNVQAQVHVLELDGCQNLLNNGHTIKLMAPQFASLKRFVVSNDKNTLTSLPSNAISIVVPPKWTMAKDYPLSIEFRDTAISQVANDAFEDLNKQRLIQNLTIASSRLTAIPFDMIDISTNNLTLLDFSGNRIGSAGAPLGTFPPTIAALDLSNNQIKQLDNTAIWNNDMDVLNNATPTWINLSNNQISTISADAFSKGYGMDPRTITVDLSSNKLANWDKLGNFTQNLLPTMTVNFSNNTLTTIGRHQFNDEWLATKNVPELFTENPFLCNENDFGWFACLLQHQLNSTAVAPTPSVSCTNPGTSDTRTTTDWVQQKLSPDGTCFYYFPQDGNIFKVETTTPSPPPTSTPSPWAQPCSEYASLGLDFSTSITWPCVCNQIRSTDLRPCNSSYNNCTGTTEAVFKLDVTCANSDTIRVQQAWQQMHYILPDAYSRNSSATSLRVAHNIKLVNISVNEDVWQPTHTPWDDLLVSTSLMPTPPIADNTHSDISGITFAEQTLNNNTNRKSLHLNLGPAFSALESFGIVDALWLTQLPANVVKIQALNPAPADGYFEILFNNTSLATIDPQAFAALLPAGVTAPAFTISHSKLTAIPFDAMRPFNITSEMDFGFNFISSVELPAGKSVPYCAGDIDLTKNSLSQITDKAFWNWMTSNDKNDTSPKVAPASISLNDNSISSISTNAFNVFAAGKLLMDNGTEIDLSNNKLVDAAHGSGAFKNLNETVKIILANNQIRTIKMEDLTQAAWNGTEQPQDFADNLFQCDSSLNWFACWAQHTAGNMSTGDLLPFLQCADKPHEGKSLHDFVVSELNDNGVCRNYFPEDDQFNNVYPCNKYQELGLDFDATISAPCKCVSISSAEIGSLQNATITVALTCANGNTDQLAASWQKGLSTALPSGFASQYNVTNLTLKYNITLDSITLARTSWDTLLNMSITPVHTSVYVNHIWLNNIIDFGKSQSFGKLQLNFASSVFQALHSIYIKNAPGVTNLPHNAIQLPATVVEPGEQFTLSIDSTKISSVDQNAFYQLGTVRTSGIDLALTNGALELIPTDTLKDLQKIITLSFAHNNIASIEYLPDHEPSGIDTYLDLSYNKITLLNNTYWNHLNSTQALPQTVDLSNNGLNTVVDNAFQGFASSPATHEIFLSNNALTAIPAAVRALPSRTVVHFQNNQIHKIVQSDFSGAMAEHMDNTLYSNNPYFCSNDIIWFACWAQHTTESWTALKDLTCSVGAPTVMRESLTTYASDNLAACYSYFPNDPLFAGGSPATTTTTPSPTVPTTSSSAALYVSMWTMFITLGLMVVASKILLVV